MKKIIIMVVSLMLILGCVFGFLPYKFGLAETYDYTGTIVTDSSYASSDYAIKSIESMKVSSTLVVTFNCYVSGDTYIFYGSTKTARPTGINLFYNVSNIRFNAPGTFFASDGYTILPSYFNDGYNYISYIEFHDGSFTEYSPNSNLLRIYTKGNFKITVGIELSANITDDAILNTFVDMSSGSSNIDAFYSANKNYYDDPYYYLPYAFGKFVFGSYFFPNLNVPTNFESVSSSSSSAVDALEKYFYVGDYSNSTNIQFLFGIMNNNLSSKTYSYNLYNIEFGVYRPTARINNTLVLYNYNYSYLNCVGRLNYNMRKGNDNYFIATSGSNGYIPNSYFIYVYNDELNNRIFDEYVTINMGSAIGSSTLGYDSSALIVENSSLYYNLGFDFNFTYYTEPLVSSIGSYNFDFDKPSYVKMNFSLTPLYLPVLEAVENIFIFLVFYCPVISDILALLKLDLFIGGLVSILNYLFGLQIGQFLTSCIAFIIFFAILKSFMPIVMNAGSGAIQGVKDIYNDSQFAYNRREKKKRNLQRKEQRKQEKYQKKVMSRAVKKRKK